MRAKTCKLDRRCFRSPPADRASPWRSPTSRPPSGSSTDIAARAGARRPGDAVGRSRRRQDHVRARDDPLSRRQSGHRGAEPDLHADADLRAAALSGRACRPLPARRPGRARRARLRRPAQGRRGAAGMAGPRRRIPAAGPARRRVHARAAGRARSPQRADHRLWRLRAARRAHRRRSAAFSMPTGYGQAERAAHPGRRLDALLRAAARTASSAPS